MTPAWLLLLMALNVTAATTPPPIEGDFEFVVDTATYTEPSGEGAFDFKVEV